MKRRDFITLVGGAAVLAWAPAARAQQGERMRHVAILMPYPPSEVEYQARVRALRQELGNLGWTSGVNVQFDERWTSDNMDLIRAAAANLVELKPDVIVAVGGRVIPVLMQLTRSIPIIVPGGANPVERGWAESLARPGGNVTGFSQLELSIVGKQVEVLKQIVPGISRVAAIHNPDNPVAAFYLRSFQSFAGPLSIEPVVAPIHGLPDIERVVESFADQRNCGILFLPDVTTNALRDQVIALVARHRVPAVFTERAFVLHGGLASYGADRIDLFRRAASYVDRVLRGEKPGDLPYQQPTKYELWINLKTAKALGLTVPPSLLATADEVIE
jgi:putative tryptophan/tyrosine transport system substrate-binding protein